MKRCLFLVLAFVVFYCSIWPAGVVSAQESTGGGAAESQYSGPLPAEVPQEQQQAAPAEEAPAHQEEQQQQQYAPPPAPPAREEQASAPGTATEPVAVPSESQFSPAEQYDEEPAPIADDPAPPPLTVEEPAPSDPPPFEPTPPQAEPARGEGGGTMRPASHCGGLFGPGPPEGTPCDAPSVSSPPPAADDAGQYQYDGPSLPPSGPEPAPEPPPGDAPPDQTGPVEEPAPDPSVPSDPEPSPEEPTPSPEEPPAAEPEPSPAAPEPPEPADRATPPDEVVPCEDAEYTCELDVPEGYSCAQVYGGNREPGEDPLFYQCTDYGEDYVDGPDGEACHETLIYEERGGPAKPGYVCGDKYGDCVYNADWSEYNCTGFIPEPEPYPDPYACGDDDCGLDVQPRYQCRELDDGVSYSAGGRYKYECFDPEGEYVKSPWGESCEKTVVYFRDVGSEAEPHYFCMRGGPTPDDGKAYCGFYDAKWRPIPCQGGGPGGVGEAWENSGEASEVVSGGRGGPNGDGGPGGAGSESAGGSGSRSPGSGGSGGLLDLLTPDADSTDTPAGPEEGSGATLGAGAAPVEPLGEDVSFAPADGTGFSSSPTEAALPALLGGPGVPEGDEAGRRPANDGGSSPSTFRTVGEGPAGVWTPLTYATPAGERLLSSLPFAAPAVGEGRTPFLAAVAVGGGSTPPADDPWLASAPEYGLVDREDVRLLAYLSAADGAAGSREPASGGRASAGDRPLEVNGRVRSIQRSPNGSGRTVVSPDRLYSLTSVALALFAVGTVLVVGRTRLRGRR